MNPILQRKGYLQLQRLLPPKICVQLCEALAIWREKNRVPNPYGILHHNIYQSIPLFEEVLYRYKLGEIACSIFGEDLYLFQDNLIWKPPGTEQEIEWHQDYSYWPLSAPRGLTLWIALEDCRREQGAIAYIPTSHHWGECLPTNFIQKGDAFWGKDLPKLPIEQSVDNREYHSLRAGEAIIHHPLCCHQSGSNQTQLHRRGWSLSFVSTDVRWDPEHAPHPYNHWYNPQKGDTLHKNNFPRFSDEGLVHRD
ncbi:MAG: phytanoyl-CoA dioxygenase family protein [Myxococcota bacterium]|nr:phytanoyl-CoA dioxygenase family protein [Myxococcota bacterium]